MATVGLILAAWMASAEYSNRANSIEPVFNGISYNDVCTLVGARTFGLEMATESSMLCETPSTIRTLVWFLPCVRTDVSFKRTALTEYLRAHRACIGHAIGVRARVNLARILQD